MLRLVQNVILPGLLLFVSAGFLVNFFRKEPFRTPAGDAAIILGLLIAVGTVLYLHPNVQERVQIWLRLRADERERQFWQGRDREDEREAQARAQVAAERLQRRQMRKKQDEGGGGG